MHTTRSRPGAVVVACRCLTRNVLELDVSLSEHGEAVAPELDERARRLLGLKR